MEKKFNYLVRLIGKKTSAAEMPISFALRLTDNTPHVFGKGTPAFTIVVNDAKGLAALCSLDATSVAESYMAGGLDIQGDMLQVFALRDMFSDRHPLHFVWRFVRPIIFGQVSTDKKSISHHYDYDGDFYRLFLDRRHRCYSQGVFLNDDEPLENAMTRKLDFAIESTGLRPGDRVLDIGAGWGAFVEHAGGKGIKVTGLTISKQSEKFVSDLISKQSLPCEVLREHFFEHKTDWPYDAIVNCGVTEHLPDYRKTLAKYHELLKPGGNVYLDASAAREKYRSVTFGTRHIYPGNHSQLCLHDYLAHFAHTPFQLKVVHDDGHSYYLTLRHWAENLDRHRSEVATRWGESLYRKFQVYLWGCVDNFVKDRFQAYRMVLHLPQ
ncbi:MAG TPA: class I SAM-dependent methyltransferase [Pyrinomonadaceae bacterium]